MFVRLLFAVLMTVVFAAVSLGATYTVTKIDDTNDGVCDSDCSLREAVVQANQASDTDLILFLPAVFTTPQVIVLSHVDGDLDILHPVTIAGRGSKVLTLQQSVPGERVVDIELGITATVFGVALQGGQAVNDGTDGGGLRNLGTAIIQDVRFVGNSANTLGGGLYTNGDLTARDCLWEGNDVGVTATLGLPAGGGVYVAAGVARISNSTLTANSTVAAGTSGGAIGVGTDAVVNLVNVTIANNSAPSGAGGGIGVGNATVNLRNTIVANNNAGSPSARDLFGSPSTSFVSNGHNLIRTIPASYPITDGVNNDIVGGNPFLASIADNGGNSRTIALQPQSPAIDGGNNCVTNNSCGANSVGLANDQRGPGFTRLIGTNVDIGAFEYLAPTAASVTILGRVADNTQGIRGARVTLLQPDGQTISTTTNSFGYFRFEQVTIGQGVLILVTAKRYSFDPVFLFVVDEVADLLIEPSTAGENKRLVDELRAPRRAAQPEYR